jgi:hypothetical protein
MFNPPPPENRVLYETMWKRIVDLDRPHMTIWHMRIACCILKTTNTHSEYIARSVFFHYNNGCTKVPQCYVIRTLPDHTQIVS